MTQITIKLNLEDLRLLATLASDQLFRREFIDPKMPGYKADPAEVQRGKALVSHLRHMLEPAPADRTPAQPAAYPSDGAPQPRNRAPNAV
jgi:hypothetical protein